MAALRSSPLTAYFRASERSETNNGTTHFVTPQTGGKLLTERSMSRLLKVGCPKTLTKLEEISFDTR